MQKKDSCFNELMSIFSGNLTDANREYIREKVVLAKVRSVEENSLDSNKESITADSPIPFSIDRAVVITPYC